MAVCLGEFVEPGKVTFLRDKHPGKIQVPAVWSTVMNHDNPDESLPGTGYGSYLL